jgi:hypothetical protein
MNIALWIIQIILGIKLIDVSITHGFRHSLPNMQTAIQKIGKFSPSLLNGIASCTLLGTMGLILPGILGLPAWITPVTAGLLSILLGSSIFFHVKGREKPKIFVSIVLLAFAVFVAYGRWAW